MCPLHMHTGLTQDSPADHPYMLVYWDVLLHTVPSGSLIPAPVHSPRNASPEPSFWSKSMKMVPLSSSIFPWIVHGGDSLVPSVHPSPRRKGTGSTPSILPVASMVRGHPGWLGSLYTPANTVVAEAGCADSRPTAATAATPAIASASAWRATPHWVGPLSAGASAAAADGSAATGARRALRRALAPRAPNAANGAVAAADAIWAK
mmetsp:Transcript_8286/g.21126  ORF Transcript_8286/g.21126 Transcript_8286/m.21126 type:complete len:206 (+) Transcript_8286:157-774(+)